MKLDFDIAGKKWVMRLLTKKQYRKKYGRDSVAITNIDKRRIDVSHRGVDKETFVHELVHAYLGEFCTHSADLDDENLEEIFAELMAKRGEEILKLADDLLFKSMPLDTSSGCTITFGAV